MTDKKPKASPIQYSQELANEICARLANGESMRAICKDDHMPSEGGVYNWLHTKEGFDEQYTRARKAQAHFYAEQVIEIADTEEDPQRARVRMDARRWYAGSLHSQVYGTRINQDVKVDITKDLTDEQLEAQIATRSAEIQALEGETGASGGEGETAEDEQA